MKKTVSSEKGGFTLLEILLVVGIIAILAGIVILAINPTKQLGDTRNAQRRSDVLTILNGIYQYSIDNNGSLPDEIMTGTCEYGTNSIDIGTAGFYINLYTDLVVSAASSTYLVAIPHDPLATSTNYDSNSTGDSGYAVILTSSGRVTVCAPLAEQDVTIEVTR